MEEQEEEIKQLNSAILQAKIYAIRDAQLAEKEAIAAELRDEEARLDSVGVQRKVMFTHSCVDDGRGACARYQRS